MHQAKISMSSRNGLEKFFDKVNCQRLMMKIAEKVKDKTILLLVRRFIQSNVFPGIVVIFIFFTLSLRQHINK